MHPYLFDWLVNGHHIRPPTFGVLLAVAFSSGYFLALRNALFLKINPKYIEHLFLILIGTSILGGRLFHVLFEDFDFYLSHPDKIIAVWEGGYTFYGSALAGILGIFFYCRSKHLSYLNFLDIVVTSSALGLAIGRIGCFAAGCCWGKVCNLPWGVTFSHPDAFNPVLGQPVHPTQLYEAFGAFCIFVFCQKKLGSRSFMGEIGLKGICLYSLLRFTVEFYRGDSYRGFILGGLLSYSQAVSITLGIVSLSALAVLSRKTKN